jgi:hypothetical protein
MWGWEVIVGSRVEGEIGVGRNTGRKGEKTIGAAKARRREEIKR